MAECSLPGFLHEENIYFILDHECDNLIIFGRGSKSLDIPGSNYKVELSSSHSYESRHGLIEYFLWGWESKMEPSSSRKGIGMVFVNSFFIGDDLMGGDLYPFRGGRIRG